VKAGHTPGCSITHGSQRVAPPPLNIMLRWGQARTESFASRTSGHVAARTPWMNSAPPSTGRSQKSRIECTRPPMRWRPSTTTTL
jgi:hypothetical protein